MGQGLQASSYRQDGLSSFEQKILADKVQRIERTLDQLEFQEYDGTMGERRQRDVRVNINSGVRKGEWITTNNVDTGTDVDKITAGAGIGVSPATGKGDVTVSNTGVTQIVAGAGISINPAGGVGAVTVANTSGLPAGGTQYQVLQRDGSGNAVWDVVRWI